ncbi:MAG: peptide-modifying radical SAM enzyme CbpB [Thermodesulfobacteriaceae bacterium]|nr:peptide-modifying radical SAM enzyme CbpB [Thermodesulfobacteriaceae bacterium]MDW8135647.1 peptide-modifying radical SAM enzyme CbpB [Thermodesulfobacterium sp.]
MKYANTGYGPNFLFLEIGAKDYVVTVEPDTAFWALVEKDSLSEVLKGELIEEFEKKKEDFQKEIDYLRFGLKPSAVYFNPTERCNFNCPYCYIPEEIRKNGKTMKREEILEALGKLKFYFYEELKLTNFKPQVIFHGSEPLLTKEEVFYAIECFSKDFIFGIQTNGTLLEKDDIKFLKEKGVSLGLSLDAPFKEVADLTRKNWAGKGAFEKISKVLGELRDYPAFNVIATITKVNVNYLPEMIDFSEKEGLSFIMLNPVRLTQKGGQELKPEDEKLTYYFIKALEKIYEIFEKKGKKIVVTNFANLLAGIIGPTTRKLMCDISPCGGGRCFFAVSAKGEVFPCSEFIGFEEFKGGNLFKEDLSEILESFPFKEVTQRKVEDIIPCYRCALRNFCGAPCPAEVYAFKGSLKAPSPYCAFYEELIRYAFKLIAEGKEEIYLWKDWEVETKEIFKLAI